MGKERGMHLHVLPDVILTTIFSLVSDGRSRNAMSLACQKWRNLERATRRSITLRGNVRDLFFLPTCFPSITNLDVSLLSPWGYSFLHHQPHHHNAGPDGGGGHYNDPFHLPDHVIAGCLRRAFPLVASLTVYARTPSILQVLAPQWPGLQHVKLVRWHQRPPSPPGSDFLPLLHGCPSLTSLDLSSFYCWTEDIPAALQAQNGRPVAAKFLTRLDLSCVSSVEGFKSQELIVISSACPNLRQMLAPCVFDPRYHDFVGDDVLVNLASNCKNLSTLHLIDYSALSAPRANPGEDEGVTTEDAGITPLGLENLFMGLPMLEDLVLDVCHNVNYAGSALEALNRTCPRITSLKLGQFHGVCRATALHLDGVAVCGGLKSLSIKNSFDLTDASLVAIARGCSRLSKFEIQGCKMVTETGLRKFASMLRATLVDVSISCCKHLDAARSLQALEPVRDLIQRLHIDCIWSLDGQELLKSENGKNASFSVDLDEFDEDAHEEDSSNMSENGNHLKNKKCRLSTEFSVYGSNDLLQADVIEFWCRTWKQLKYLSLWVPVGELLIPLAELGLENCPVLEEICIKVEGDCRMCPAPTNQAFGLTSLAYYPQLSQMKLDCGDAIGYHLTAPNGQVDLSEWELFFLNGIEKLKLAELDYWPPQDKDMNQRRLCLPAVALLAECATLRRLFIHGTTNEHFMTMLLKIPDLRDVQLREDYYPAPENDTSTEMRVESCRRFEDKLNRRVIPD